MAVGSLAGLFKFSIGGNTPMWSVPFPIKLIVCILLDIASLPVVFLKFFPEPVTTAIGAVAGTVMGGIHAVVCYLFFGSPALAMTAFVEESTIQAIPFLTMISLWNGYKTGWKY
jgi:hypothetical protein